ncbi:hypothetical protein ACERK3_16445 [Phycisphaerales bacterium AB-hyl4]|uniref:Non-specific serine/threonine protein kinase n=1 Tax=Natronomicrosphaera hydrolytica TaxID=3242702 RepID=A0ABV4UB54_9BACT
MTDPAQATRDASAGPAHRVRCFKADGRRAVWLVQRPGQPATTVKCWPLTPALLVKLALGRSQAQRQARGVSWLQAAGIATTAVARAWHFTRHGSRFMVELELDHAPGHTVHELVVEGKLADPALARHVGQSVGRAAAAIAHANLFHDDFKPSNLVIDLDHHLDAQLIVIDTASLERARRRRPTAILAEMLHKLGIPLREAGVTTPPPLWRAVMRTALLGLTRADRRAVIQRVRQLYIDRQRRQNH